MKQAYLVGGAVRDALLGWPVKDRDWVVVGADPAAMVAAGYTAVGRDFPVFLHPETHEEYALARTERKTAPGYHGFAFHAAADVTLEQDLARRDLTINAMAQDDGGQIIDPYGGRRDLADKLLRHVSPAFAEDPVRILRLARFAARFEGFSVAPETQALMCEMVAAGEVDALVAERVWQEFAKGLMEARPERMIEVLRDCGALARLAPELDALFGVPQPAAHHPEVDTGVHVLMVLRQCALQQAPLTVRYACLCHDLGKGLTPADVLPRHIGHEGRGLPLVRRPERALAGAQRLPRNWPSWSAREHTHVHQSEGLQRRSPPAPDGTLAMPGAAPNASSSCSGPAKCDARGRLGLEDRPYPQREGLLKDLRAVQAVDLATVSAAALAEGRKGPEIGRAVQRARLAALGNQGRMKSQLVGAS